VINPSIPVSVQCTVVNGSKANWIGHILHRNWVLKYVNEGKIPGTEDEEEDVGS
jgi:hypothetical protein